MSNEQKVFDDFFDEWRQHDEAMYRLYQAAPDLLAACQDMVASNMGQPSGVGVPALDTMRAAIAKATGTS